MHLRRKRLGGVLTTSLLTLTFSAALRGDLKYQESTQITGGMLEGATKLMSFFGAIPDPPTVMTLESAR